MTGKIVTIIFILVIAFALLGFARGMGIELTNDGVQSAVDRVFAPLEDATAWAWE